MLHMSLLAENTPVKELSFCAIDLETTGLFYFSGDRICELGAVRVTNGVLDSCLKTFVNPARPLTKDSSAVSGITDEMIKKSPYFKDIAEKFLRLIEGSVLVFHNAGFDMGFINSELGRLGLSFPELPVLDTRMIAKESFSFESHRLGALTSALGITHSVRHRAITDAILTYRLLAALTERMGDIEELTLADLIKAQGRLLKVPESPKLPEYLQEYIKRGARLRVRYISKKGIKSVKYFIPTDWGEYKGSTYLIGKGEPCLKDTVLRTDRVVDIRPAV